MKNYIRYATEFENEAVEFILKTYGSDYLLQMSNLVVSSREYTGHGIYVNFKNIKDILPNGSENNFIGGSIYAEIDGLKYGGGFSLNFKKGNMIFLEVFSQGGEKWPEVINKFELRNLLDED